jgi:hypothetical protein
VSSPCKLHQGDLQFSLHADYIRLSALRKNCEPFPPYPFSFLFHATRPSIYFVYIHFQRGNSGFEIQQRQRNRELWKFSFKITEVLLNFLRGSISQNLIFACKKYCKATILQSYNGLSCQGGYRLFILTATFGITIYQSNLSTVNHLQG